MPRNETLEHLARLYAADPDPWGHRSRPYERDKFDRTLAALGPGRYALGLEIGCGNGTLARRLAGRCDRLVALECVAAAHAEAARHLRGVRNVDLLLAAAPAGLPDVHPDLVVLSEVLYYLTPEEISDLGRWISAYAVSGARVVGVHWTGETGEALDAAAALARLAPSMPVPPTTTSFPRFRIDIFDIG